MARPCKVNREDMLALREQGLSNKEIARKLGIGYSTVFKYIGAQDANLTREIRQKTLKSIRTKVEKVAQPVTETPPEPQKGPSEPLETSGVQEVKNAPATPQNRQIIPTNRLFDFAIISDWSGKLAQLAKMASPEPWKLKKTRPDYKNADYVVLEQYLLQVFKFRVKEFNTTAENPDKVIHMRGKFCCFHTGLYNNKFQGIYAYFERSVTNSRQPWYLVGFKDAQSYLLDRIHPLPEHCSLDYELTAPFDHNKPFRTNFSHITDRADRIERLPEAIRGYWNLSLLLETALLHARRTAALMPSFPVTTSRPGEASWLLPLYITNPDTPDVVAFVEDMGDYYHCRTCITPEMAYLTARVNGRPTAAWLVALLDDNGGG